MSIPPQVLLDIQRGHVSLSEDGSSTLTFEAGRRYFVPIELAEDLVLAGSAKAVEPVDACGVETVDALRLIEEWKAERAYRVDLEEWRNFDRALKGDTAVVAQNRDAWLANMAALEQKHIGRPFAPQGE